jgi:hypothetical protein
MVRAVLSIVGILATVAVMMWCFGITVPQVTTNMPALNHSVARTVGLMQGGASENGRTPADAGPGAANAPAPATPAAPSGAPPFLPNVPLPAPAAAPRPDQPEIITPYSGDHLNPTHIQGIEPTALAWTAPQPLPAHRNWTWDVGNREFTNVVITHVDADLVNITSDSGTAQIDIALLPPEIRRELNYDPALAEQAAAARSAQAAASKP